MSLRHLPRQSDIDARILHEPPSGHLHPQLLSAHHPNGSSAIPTTPGSLSNGSQINTIVSPATVPTVVTNGVAGPTSTIHKLAAANEQTWLLIGRVAEQMGDLEHALSAYENALRHNPMSLSGLTQVAGIARIKENYPKAVDYFQRVLHLQEDNGEVWSALGHCYLMQDDLQKAYSAYQQALYLLPNPKEDPKLWYGIGILYDRYGSLDHAEEAFSSVLRMDKDFDKATEILFRLGIIYKQQGKYDDSLNCFDRILRNPPSPLAHADIWFQIGHVYEQQKDHLRAKDAYERVVADNPGHAKVLQQLGWLYHQDGSSFQNQDLAIQSLTKSLEADPSDAQSWYLLGRAYMAGQKYNKAYEAYQQAVYRDGRNPTFWCSIGVLYFQINQFRDALDAYSRAIRINPYISEVWFDLGSLYESCNNQISDAIDAYARASELDPGNPVISQRLQLLKTAQATGGQLPAAPGPQDVHPTAYASAVVPPPGLSGPPLLLQGARPAFRADSRGPGSDGPPPLPPPSQAGSRSSPGPFRGGPPPPVIIDETRHMPSHTPLAPMDVDRPGREYAGASREPPARGPAGHQSLLLHQPVPHQHVSEDIRGAAHPGHHQDSYFTKPSSSISPPPHATRFRSPPPGLQAYHPRQSGAQPPSAVPSQQSPRVYAAEPGRPVEQDGSWDRRPAPSEHQRDWDRGDRERRPRHSGEYPAHPVQPASFYPAHSPAPLRGHTPSERSPRPLPSRSHWESKPLSGPSSHHTLHSPPLHTDPPPRRYDPRYDAPKEHERELPYDTRSDARAYPSRSPEGLRALPRNIPPSHLTARVSESPPPAPAIAETKERRRRGAKDKDVEPQSSIQGQEQPVKKERKKRTTTKRVKDDQARQETPKPYVAPRSTTTLSGSFKMGYGKGAATPDTSSNGSVRSVRLSPTIATPRPPSRVVDENYDEGVAESLINLASYRAPEVAGLAREGNGPLSHSPTVSSGSRHREASPRVLHSHRNSVSSTRSHASPPSQSASLKRPLSPGSDEMESKRSRMDGMKRKVSSPSRRQTSVPPATSSRASPPFRTPPQSRQGPDPYPASPPLPTVLPPHPRPIGAGLASIGNPNTGPIALPPIATLSPTPSTHSPSASVTDRDRDERMQVDGPRSISPPSRMKFTEQKRTSHSPKNTPSPRSPRPSNSEKTEGSA